MNTFLSASSSKSFESGGSGYILQPPSYKQVQGTKPPFLCMRKVALPKRSLACRNSQHRNRNKNRKYSKLIKLTKKTTTYPLKILKLAYSVNSTASTARLAV